METGSFGAGTEREAVSDTRGVWSRRTRVSVELILEVPE